MLRGDTPSPKNQKAGCRICKYISFCGLKQDEMKIFAPVWNNLFGKAGPE